jgi:hypothetical protein
MKEVEFFRGGTVTDHNILDMDHGIPPGMGKADKIGKGCRRTLCHHLDSAIRKVPDIPVHPGCLRTVRDIVPVSYSLDPSHSHGGDPFHSIFPDAEWFIDW